MKSLREYIMLIGRKRGNIYLKTRSLIDIAKQIQISENIWQKTKIHCPKKGISLKEFVEKLINDEIKKNKNLSSK